MTTVKTNKLAGPVKGRGGTILRSELSILLTETFFERRRARPSSAVATAQRRPRRLSELSGEPAGEGLLLAQLGPYDRCYFWQPAAEAVWDVSDPNVWSGRALQEIFLSTW